jgi:Flp pilus assembly pilin Flp
MLDQAGRKLMVTLQWLFCRAERALARGHSGQSMVEYGIVVALVAIVAFAVVKLLGQEITRVFQTILDNLRGTSASVAT